jgi:hypothetical protein
MGRGRRVVAPAASTRDRHVGQTVSPISGEHVDVGVDGQQCGHGDGIPPVPVVRS